jgi:hypothetical protein
MRTKMQAVKSVYKDVNNREYMCRLFVSRVYLVQVTQSMAPILPLFWCQID